MIQRRVVTAIVVQALLVGLAWAEPRPYVIVAGRSHVMFEASYLLGDFSGTTEDITAEITVDPASVPAGVIGSVVVKPAGIRTGVGERDRDLRKALAVDRYPEMRFRIGEVQASFPSLAERVDITLEVSGTMVIGGVERPLTWTGRARIEEGRLWVRGETELKLTDFGITPPRKFFLAVRDRVRASFDLRLAPRE